MSGTTGTRADAADAPGAVVMSAEERAEAQRWVEEHLVGNEAALPFSFVYEGRPSDSLMRHWTRRISRRRLDPARTQITLTWTDPRTRLTVRCVCVQYHDFPTVEWTLFFKNGGERDADPRGDTGAGRHLPTLRRAGVYSASSDRLPDGTRRLSALRLPASPQRDERLSVRLFLRRSAQAIFPQFNRRVGVVALSPVGSNHIHIAVAPDIGYPNIVRSGLR